MYKFIFLDIDGVLNSEIYALHCLNNNIKMTANEPIDERNIKHLNHIIEKTKAKVIISSSWRLSQSYQILAEFLHQKGFVGEVIGATPNLRGIERGNEILEFIRVYCEKSNIETYYKDFKDYVIIDDDDDMLYIQRNNFIQTDPYCGLTATLAQNAIEILGEAK